MPAPNPRDENGWNVPRAGTQARHVYDLTRAGWHPTAIAAYLGKSENNVRVTQFYFRHTLRRPADATSERQTVKG